MPEKRSERSIPQSWRDSVAKHLERWIGDRPPTAKGKPESERALAKELKISQYSLNKLRNKEGPFGLHILVALTEPLEVTLDELLGIPLTPAAVRRILREELAAHDAAKAASSTKRAGR